MPLKKLFKREEAIACDKIKNRIAIIKNRGFDLLNASRTSLISTFVNTRYKESPVMAILRKILVMLQSFFLSIKNASNLVSFPVCAFKIGTYIYFRQYTKCDELDAP